MNLTNQRRLKPRRKFLIIFLLSSLLN